MAFFKVLVLFVAGGLLLLIFIGALSPKPSRETGVMSVQRILVANQMGWKRSAITGIGHRESSVTKISENRFHVRNWYTTPLTTTAINYKMIVTYSPSSDTYYNQCFSTAVDHNGKDCF